MFKSLKDFETRLCTPEMLDAAKDKDIVRTVSAAELRHNAVELCRHLKANFNLKDSQLPDKIFWDNNEVSSNPPTLSFDVLMEVRQDVSARRVITQEVGAGLIALVMWMFDIKKEEIAGRARKKISFEMSIPEYMTPEGLVGKAVTKDAGGPVVGSIVEASWTDPQKRLALVVEEIDEDVYKEIIEPIKKSFHISLLDKADKNDKFVYVRPEQEEDFLNNSDFIEAPNPSYPILVKDLKEGEIGMLNGERIIVMDVQKEDFRRVSYETFLPVSVKESDLQGRKITLGLDGPVIGRVLKAKRMSFLDDINRQKFSIEAEMKAEELEKIINDDSLNLRDSAVIHFDADEANNKKEVGVMAKKGRRPKKKKDEKQESEQDAQEETPAIGEEAD